LDQFYRYLYELFIEGRKLNKSRKLNRVFN